VKLKENDTVRFFAELIERCIKDEIGMSAAALVYYMIFSFFPMIIVLSMILGFADIDTGLVTASLSHFMPSDVINIIEKYLLYVSEKRNGNILAASILFTFYFPVRAVNYIMLGVNKAYGSAGKRKLSKRILLTAMFSLVLAFGVFASIILLAAGRTLLEIMSAINIIIPVEFIDTWVYLRFIILAAAAIVVVTMLYILAPVRKVRFLNALPGAVSAVSLWITVSAAFSYYVENMGKYSVLFGSVGAVMVLLLWLYITASVLLLGAEINAVLEGVNKEKP